MSREGNLVKNTIILAIGTFFPKMVIFVTLPILTAYLTQEEYGTYDLVLTLVSLVLPAATLQIHSAAFRFLIDAKDNEAEKTVIISNIYGFIITTSLISLVILFFALGNQTFAIRSVICVYFFFDIMVNASRQVIRGLSRNIDYAISAFISSVGQIILIVVLVMGLRKGLFGVLAALAAAELFTTVYLLIRGKIYKYLDYSKISWTKLKEYLGYSWPMVPNSISQWVMHASDRLIITFFMGVSANAIFAVAYKIPSIISFAQTTFNMAWQENASIVSKDDDVAAYYSKMFEWLFNIVSGGMAVLIGIAPILFAILVNGDYDAAYYHIPLLCMGMLFFSLSSFWGGIFVAFKKTKSVGMTTVISAVVHIILVLLLINWIGLYAASIATVVSYIILCVLRLRGVEAIIHIEYKWKHIVTVLSVLFLQCVVCALRSPPLNILNFVIGISFGVSINMDLLMQVIKKIKKML